MTNEVDNANQVETNGAVVAPCSSHCSTAVPFAPYYADEAVTIYNADYRKVLPFLDRFDLLLTDPPYGLGKANGRRMHAYRDPAKSKGKIGGDGAVASKEYSDTSWDNETMTIQEWESLKCQTEIQIVWGVEYQVGVLGVPPRWLCWDKKCKNGWNDTFSDFELAYFSQPGRAKMHRHRWMGMISDSKEHRCHPTQKPQALMQWCLSLAPKAKTVLDPFAGSGTTGVAAKLEGRKATLIEISEEYCEKAADRLRQGVLF